MITLASFPGSSAPERDILKLSTRVYFAFRRAWERGYDHMTMAMSGPVPMQIHARSGNWNRTGET